MLAYKLSFTNKSEGEVIKKPVSVMLYRVTLTPVRMMTECRTFLKWRNLDWAGAPERIRGQITW